MIDKESDKRQERPTSTDRGSKGYEGVGSSRAPSVDCDSEKIFSSKIGERKIVIKSYRDIPTDRPLSTDEVEDILLNGSAKEKAIVNAIAYTDRRITDREEAISLEEYHAIVDSLDSNVKEYEVYLKWVKTYSTLVQTYQILASYYYEFKANVAKVETHLARLDAMEREESHLNTIYKTLKEYDSNKRESDRYLESLEISFAPYADFRVNGNNEIILHATDKYLDELNLALMEMNGTLAPIKTIILAIERWIKSKRVSAILPPLLADIIAEIKNFTKQSPLLNRYRRETIDSDRDKGMNISDLRIALTLGDLKDYVYIEEEDIEEWVKRLNRIYDEEQRK